MSTQTAAPITYRGWNCVPDDLKTKTSWARNFYVLRDGERPAAYCHTRAGTYALYTSEQCQNRPEPKRARKDWPAIFGAYYLIPQFWGNFSKGTHDAAELCVLRDACAFLFSLNRYTKHAACTPKQRADIYALKNRLVRGLFLSGYCVRAYMATSPTYEGECFGCHGTGTYYRYNDEYDDGYGDDDDEVCWRCDGTGVYKSGGRPYWSFAFVIGDENSAATYVWHQPAHLAYWATLVGEQPHDAPPVTVEKEQRTGLAQRRIPEAKAHLAWVCENLERRYPVPFSPPLPALSFPLLENFPRHASPAALRLHTYSALAADDVPF